MLAYVKLVQEKEKEIGCDVLTHQKWRVLRMRAVDSRTNNLFRHRSGANYIDRILQSVSSGSASSSSTGKDSTENSF
jgi:isocitrate lyase